MEGNKPHSTARLCGCAQATLQSITHIYICRCCNASMEGLKVEPLHLSSEGPAAKLLLTSISMQMLCAVDKPLNRLRIRGHQTRTRMAKCAPSVLYIAFTWPPLPSIGRERKSLFHDNLSHGCHVPHSVPSVDKSTLSSNAEGSRASQVPVQPYWGHRIP